MQKVKATGLSNMLGGSEGNNKNDYQISPESYQIVVPFSMIRTMGEKKTKRDEEGHGLVSNMIKSSSSWNATGN